MPRITCQCGARFKFSESVIGKKAKCKKCGTVLTLKEDDEGSIPIAADPEMDGKPVLPTVATAASADAAPSFAPPGGIPKVIIEAPETPDTYARSLARTLLFPTSVHNLFTFIGLWIVLFIGSMVPIVSLLFTAWWAAFRFKVVAGGAGGDEDIPGIVLSTDWYEEMLLPLFRWLGSWFFVLLPAFAYGVIAISQGWITFGPTGTAVSGGLIGLLQTAGGVGPLLLLMFAGMFFWPMIVLCIALGGFGCIYRIELILSTIMRTFPAYLLTVLIVFSSDGIKALLSGWVGEHLLPVEGTAMGTVLGMRLLVKFLTRGISIYFEIVAMRMIGLYYHHFKDRFAWSWG